MRTRVIVDGAYSWSENEPARARVAGFGGRMIVDAAPRQRTRTDAQRDARAAARQVLKAELAGDPRPNTRRCAASMPQAGEPCARFVGHADTHRTRAALDYDAGTG